MLMCCSWRVKVSQNSTNAQMRGKAGNKKKKQVEMEHQSQDKV